ncbi:MAG: NnrU family protein [Proteobacteria bacterium]|nr:NnrU family protein [Pseudomonadota bacterium]
MGMTYLLAGMALFFGAHSTAIIAPAWRDRMAARLGENAWKAVYSVASIMGFLLMIKGYGLARAEPVPLYFPPTWLRHVAALLMLPVFPLLLATYLPGRIKSGIKHPMLTATKLWAVAHLLANGMLADVLLFGGFLAWAVADRISLKRRPSRPGRALPEGRFNDLVAVVAGFALYVWFVARGHLYLFGVSPMGGG